MKIVDEVFHIEDTIFLLQKQSMKRRQSLSLSLVVFHQQGIMIFQSNRVATRDKHKAPTYPLSSTPCPYRIPGPRAAVGLQVLIVHRCENKFKRLDNRLSGNRSSCQIIQPYGSLA